MRDAKRGNGARFYRFGDSAVVHGTWCPYVEDALHGVVPTPHRVHTVSVREVADLHLRACRECRPSVPHLRLVHSA